MEPGRKYRVVTTPVPGVWLKPRVFVATYLGETGSGELSFSFRPEAGTTDMPRSQIARAEEVPAGTPAQLPRIHRG